jgi:hypothetical protein
MAAQKSGGTAGRLRAKNQAVAAMMKAQGVKRNVCRCPICHKLVGVDSLYAHIGVCN